MMAYRMFYTCTFMNRTAVFLLLFLYSLSFSVVSAQSRKGVDLSTDIAMFVPSAGGGVISLIEGEKKRV